MGQRTSKSRFQVGHNHGFVLSMLRFSLAYRIKWVLFSVPWTQEREKVVWCPASTAGKRQRNRRHATDGNVGRESSEQHGQKYRTLMLLMLKENLWHKLIGAYVDEILIQAENWIFTTRFMYLMSSRPHTTKYNTRIYGVNKECKHRLR